jgi:acetylornithine deacetylase/succinyl-diaminopimelate desuccinylase-like protein
MNVDTTAHEQLSESMEKINHKWDSEIIPLLKEFIAIPNKSVMFDAEWKKNGYMDQAVELFVNWCKAQPIKGMKLDIIEEDGRTPLIFMDIPGQNDDTVFLYGHLDKQPEMVGWDDNKGPWIPVMEDDKLYGRGGADDGYAVFAALTAIATLQENDIPHSRCVVIIEASEESGSPDLVHYLDQLKARIGNPSLIVALDSGCGNYDQLWNTTSLRGVMSGNLTVKVLDEGMHSGVGSGVVPAAPMIMRQLLDRLENNKTGHIKLESLHVDIPTQRIEQAEHAAEILNHEVIDAYAWAGDTRPVTDDIAALLLNRTWSPALSVTGVDGTPAIADAGNVTLPEVSAKLSMRLPPTKSPKIAAAEIKTLLEANPPFGATVSFNYGDELGPGWNAPTLATWLKDASELASQTFYKKPAAYMGEGGSIPFMGMLGELYPDAQFLITGVLGPRSNAHGPNEFLHIPMAKKLTGCVASIIASHFTR